MLSTFAEFLKKLDNEACTSVFSPENPEYFTFSFAVVMYHVMKADRSVSKIERKHLDGLFQREFKMDPAETEALFDDIEAHYGEFAKHLSAIECEISQNAHHKAAFMEHINHLIVCDGCRDEEFELFEKIKQHLFSC